MVLNYNLYCIVFYFTLCLWDNGVGTWQAGKTFIMGLNIVNWYTINWTLELIKELYFSSIPKQNVCHVINDTT